MTNLEEGQIVLCTVEKIVGTIVFVKLDEHDTEGTITFSEISPGRIRNIRDYVVPGKKIACKILRMTSHGIHLSLRRVKLKEKNELNEEIRKEKSSKAIIKTVIMARRPRVKASSPPVIVQRNSVKIEIIIIIGTKIPAILST